MALSNLSLVLILFAVFIAAADARNLHIVRRSAAATDPAAVCSSAAHPKLCQYLVDTYHPKTADELRDAAIEDTIKKATVAKGKADQMAREQAKDEVVARRISGCSTAFNDVVTTLTEAQNYLRSGDKTQAGVYTNAATSLVEACHDVFDYNSEGIDFPTKQLYDNIKKLSINTASVFH